METRTVNAQQLQDLHRLVSKRLEGIADLLPESYRLTLIARHTERANADIVITDDDIKLAVFAACELETDADALTLPALVRR